MIDRKFIGLELPESKWEVEKGRLRFFCKVIGETNNVYLDETAAKAAGYRSLPAPPTFLFATLLDTSAMPVMLQKMGIEIGRILHGEQSFDYFTPACAGDVLTARAKVTDIYDKKGGAMEFIILESKITNQDGASIANMRSVIIVRNA